MVFRLYLTVMLVAASAFGQGGGRGGGMGGGEGMSGAPAYVRQPARIRSPRSCSSTRSRRSSSRPPSTRPRRKRFRCASKSAKATRRWAPAVQAGKSQEELNGLIASHTVLEAQMAQVEMKAFAKVYLQLEKAQRDTSQFLFQMMKGMFREKTGTRSRSPEPARTARLWAFRRREDAVAPGRANRAPRAPRGFHQPEYLRRQRCAPHHPYPNPSSAVPVARQA